MESPGQWTSPAPVCRHLYIWSVPRPRKRAAGGVEGRITSPLAPPAGLWHELAEKMPIVTIGDSLDGAATAGEVLFDNRAGVTLALEHLASLGHRRIAVLTPTQPSTPD